jgi:Fic family protein
VHYSNLIEGNELPLIEAERATRHQLSPDTRAKIELINYVEALDLIDQRLANDALGLTTDLLKEIHGAVTAGLGRADDPHFKPHHEGEWRDGTALIVDKLTKTVMHEGPTPAEVQPRMTGMFDWLANKLEQGHDPPFVLAGVMHYGITDVHPFADGNGRVARLFQAALLMSAGVLPGRMFSFERYYADDRAAYYGALRSVRARTLNMESWLHYFLAGMVEEYERVATTIDDLTELAGWGAAPLQLTSSQQRALTQLRVEGRREFTRGEYERVAGVGRTSAVKDVQALVAHGVVQVRGRGPSTRYALPNAASSRRPSGPGRPRRWTDTLIERELQAFLDGRLNWPSPQEFRDNGRGDLYAAASRSGGIGRWRSKFGR